MLQMSLNDWIIILFLTLWKHHLTSFSLSVRTLISSSYLSSFSEYWWQTERQRNSISSHLANVHTMGAQNGTIPGLLLLWELMAPLPRWHVTGKVLACPGNNFCSYANHCRSVFKKKAMPYLLKTSCHEVNLACRCTACLCTGGNEADTFLSAAGFYWLLIYTPETPYVASNTTHTHTKKKKKSLSG